MTRRLVVGWLLDELDVGKLVAGWLLKELVVGELVVGWLLEELVVGGFVVGWLMGELSIRPGDKCQNDASMGCWNKFLVKLNLL
jgi:hypothetical protein